MLIAIEGCDGAGTTTQARLLCSEINLVHRPSAITSSRTVHLTRQPSDGPIGRLIREVLAGGHKIGTEPMPPQAIALLFAADRVDHLDREVTPALQMGHIVVSDRWFHSSFAYNVDGAMSGPEALIRYLRPNPGWIRDANAFARVPDLTILLDLEAEVAAARRAAAGRPVELFDDIQTQRRVVTRYRACVQALTKMGHRIAVVNGDQTTEAVATDVHAAVIEHMAQLDQIEHDARSGPEFEVGEP